MTLSLDLGDVLGTDDVIGTFSTLGTLAGRVTDIDQDGVDVAVLVEGLTDSLAALLAFPTCAIVGANGSHMMPRLAAAIAPWLVSARGWLLVAVDDDEQGAAGAGEAAGDAFLGAGFRARSVARSAAVTLHRRARRPHPATSIASRRSMHPRDRDARRARSRGRSCRARRRRLPRPAVAPPAHDREAGPASLAIRRGRRCAMVRACLPPRAYPRSVASPCSAPA
jgi:hypothetical protein